MARSAGFDKGGSWIDESCALLRWPGPAVLALGAGATIAGAYGHVGGDGDTQQKRKNNYVIAAWLGVDQEVPPPTGTNSDAEGKFRAALQRRGGNWVGTGTLTFGGLTGPATAAHIHMGTVGNAGPVQVPLCGAGTPQGCTDGVRTPLNLTNAQLNRIKAGQYYVNVHTAQNPPGEIRGQLGVMYRLNANLNVRQERPRPTNTRRGASGRLTGYLIKYGNRAHIDTTLTYRRLRGNATAAHIHFGRRGRAGRVLEALCGTQGTPQCKSGVQTMDDVNAATLRNLLRGLTYVNVHTAQNPPGEIRGQINARHGQR